MLMADCVTYFRVCSVTWDPQAICGPPIASEAQQTVWRAGKRSCLSPDLFNCIVTLIHVHCDTAAAAAVAIMHLEHNAESSVDWKVTLCSEIEATDRTIKQRRLLS